MAGNSKRCSEELSTLTDEFGRLKNDHSALQRMLEEFYSKQPGQIAQQLKALRNLRTRLKGGMLADASEQEKQLETMEKELVAMRSTLPQKNSIILRAVLGDLNVQLRNQDEKFRYKERYEVFKLRVTIITFLFAFICLLFPFRTLESVLHFLLVWYYCTVTIREHILRANGSRIRGWWLVHHYLSTITSALFVTWPENEHYHKFKRTFLFFTLYISVVQFLQFYYQRNSLVRLVTLGRVSRVAEVTAEGPRVRTFTDLQFLLPFLIGGYIFQFYNAYTLIEMWLSAPSAPWQVLATGIVFAVIGLGNSSTTFKVLQSKVQQRPHSKTS